MAKKSTKTTATVSTYKDRPVISLPIDADTSFSFGLAKAKAVISNMSDIVLFIQAKKTTKATVKTYKKSPVLTLAKEGRPFSFGVKKAQLIVNHASEVIAFAATAE